MTHDAMTALRVDDEMTVIASCAGAAARRSVIAMS
jgi:hypothetical protein